ncbi:MAG TPA: asparagine synthase C-terminal domain-containing protein, partial [Rhodothermales bacterium]|nr:asparagine synthase C-terminal domain-containing protein [Rhodothermales bacterium]
RSAFPVGSTVSGGLDSSSIACVASGMLNAPETPPFHTFSFVFDAVPESDERAYIEAALSALSAEKHYVHPDRNGVFGDVERTLWHLDQPPYIRNLYLWKALYEDTRKAGVRVLLDGEDGDTVISRGDATLYHMAMEGRWEEFERIIRSPQMQYYANYSVDPFYWLYKYGFPALQDQLRGRALLASGRSLNEISKRFGIPRGKLLWRQGIRPIAPLWARRLGRVLRGREHVGALLGRQHGGSGGVSNVHPLINPSFAHRTGRSARAASGPAPRSGGGTYRYGHFLALYSGVPSTVLEEDDKIAAQYGIEKRHPFFDRRLVELSLALPLELKFRDGWTRWIVRRAMSGILPEMVRWRTDKANLGPSFDRGMLELERERLDHFLASGMGPIQEYVNRDGVLKAFARKDTSQLWPPFQLAAWLQELHIEG